MNNFDSKKNLSAYPCSSENYSMSELKSNQWTLIIVCLLFLSTNSLYSQNICDSLNALAKIRTFYHESDNPLLSFENRIIFGDYLYIGQDYLRALDEYEYVIKRNKELNSNDTLLFKVALCNFELFNLTTNFQKRYYLNDDKNINSELDVTSPLQNSLLFLNKMSSTTHLSYLRDYLKYRIVLTAELAQFNSHIDRSPDNLSSTSNDLSISKLSWFNRLIFSPSEEMIQEINIFSLPQQEKLKILLNSILFPNTISPYLGAVSSTFIPGLGKVLAGRTEEGITSFLLTSGLAFASYSNFRAGNSTRGWICGLLSAGFYLGNIYGSYIAIRHYNEGNKLSVSLNIQYFLNENNYFAPDFRSLFRSPK